MQEKVTCNNHHGEGTIVRRVERIPECARFIRGIIDHAGHKAVSFFFTERGARTTPVVWDIDPKWEALPCTGFSCRERETLYALRHTIARNSCPVIKKSGDLFCDEE